MDQENRQRFTSELVELVQKYGLEEEAISFSGVSFETPNGHIYLKMNSEASAVIGLEKIMDILATVNRGYMDFTYCYGDEIELLLGIKYALERAVSTIAFEARGPLTSVIGILELLKTESALEKKDSMVDEAGILASELLKYLNESDFFYRNLPLEKPIQSQSEIEAHRRALQIFKSVVKQRSNNLRPQMLRGQQPPR